MCSVRSLLLQSEDPVKGIKPEKSSKSSSKKSKAKLGFGWTTRLKKDALQLRNVRKLPDVPTATRGLSAAAPIMMRVHRNARTMAFCAAVVLGSWAGPASRVESLPFYVYDTRRAERSSRPGFNDCNPQRAPDGRRAASSSSLACGARECHKERILIYRGVSVHGGAGDKAPAARSGRPACFI